MIIDTHLKKLRRLSIFGVLGCISACMPVPEPADTATASQHLPNKVDAFNAEMARGNSAAFKQGYRSMDWNGQLVTMMATIESSEILSDYKEEPEKVVSFLDWLGRSVMRDNFCRQSQDKSLVASGVRVRTLFNDPDGDLLREVIMTEC